MIGARLQSHGLAGLIGVGLGLVAGGWLGQQVCTASRQAQTQALWQRQTRQLAAVQQQALGAAQQGQQTRLRYRTLYREVFRYVQSPLPRLELPADWRLLHDAAAVDAAATPGPAVAAAGSVDDATALGTVSLNYEQCQDWRQQLLDWQGWWLSQQGVTGDE